MRGYVAPVSPSSPSRIRGAASELTSRYIFPLTTESVLIYLPFSREQDGPGRSVPGRDDGGGGGKKDAGFRWGGARKAPEKRHLAVHTERVRRRDRPGNRGRRRGHETRPVLLLPEQGRDLSRADAGGVLPVRLAPRGIPLGAGKRGGKADATLHAGVFPFPGSHRCGARDVRHLLRAAPGGAVYRLRRLSPQPPGCRPRAGPGRNPEGGK